MKILLVADKEDEYIWDYFDRERFKDIELIISCGDLKAEYLSFLVTMIKAPLLYVPGNHNESYLKYPPEGCVSIDGVIDRFSGIRILGLGGSQKYNKGTFQYTDSQMDRKIMFLKPKIWWNKGIDIVVAHSAAYGMGDGKDLCHQGFKGFIKLMDEYSPKYFIHGHQHLTYGNIPRISTYKNTTIINAYKYYILDYK